MGAGMTGSGKTVWVQSLLKQANRIINLPPERIVWCYSQRQPAYMEMLVTVPDIVKGIPTALEQDSYFDKLHVLTLAKQTYPGRTDFFLKQYEGAVRRPFGNLLIHLKTTTQDDCRLRTNVLPGEERFNQAGIQENIPHE